MLNANEMLSVPNVEAIVANAEPGKKPKSQKQTKRANKETVFIPPKTVTEYAETCASVIVDLDVRAGNSIRGLIIEAAHKGFTESERKAFLEILQKDVIEQYPTDDMIDKATGKRLEPKVAKAKVVNIARVKASEFSLPMKLAADNMPKFQTVVKKAATHKKFLTECRKVWKELNPSDPRKQTAPKQLTMSDSFLSDFKARLAGATAQQFNEICAHVESEAAKREAQAHAFEEANKDKAQKEAQEQADKQVQLKQANG